MASIGFEVETKYYETGIIEQNFYSIADETRELISTRVIATAEEQFKEAMIALGWTPPPNI